MNKLPALILLCFSLACPAQIPADFPVIGKADLPGAKFSSSRHFTGESLFGYMNGGAELYREYGITDAVITELDLGKGHFKCEVFKMTGPEEAFGIYSVSRFRCLGSVPVKGYSCHTRYHLQICKGAYYISIINSSGTKADSAGAVRIGNIIADRINDPPTNLSMFLPDIDSAEIHNSSVLAKGRLGLANGAQDWEDYFREFHSYCAVILAYGDNTFISVRFAAEADFQEFIRFHGWSTCDMSIYELKLSDREFVRLLGENHVLVRVVNK